MIWVTPNQPMGLQIIYLNINLDIVSLNYYVSLDIEMDVSRDGLFIFINYFFSTHFILIYTCFM